jgi:hypothetical protein
MKMAAPRVVAPCGAVEVYRRFRGATAGWVGLTRYHICGHRGSLRFTRWDRWRKGSRSLFRRALTTCCRAHLTCNHTTCQHVSHVPCTYANCYHHTNTARDQRTTAEQKRCGCSRYTVRSNMSRKWNGRAWSTHWSCHKYFRRKT